MSRTLILSDELESLDNATDVIEKLGYVLDVIVDASIDDPQAATVISMKDGQPVVIRERAGPIDFLSQVQF